MAMMDPRNFSSVEEECHYWKELAKLYRQEKSDCQKEFEDFTDESRQLEQELETTLIQNEKQIRDLNGMIMSLRDENESLRQRVASHERDAGVSEEKVIQLITERDSLKHYIRELEQKNDDLERTNRVVSESVSGFEAMLNQAYEKNAMLEMEIDEKEQMQINLQRLMDEARDLKQELKIRNISLPPHPSKLDTSTISTTSSPAKDSNVSKLNDLNDSKNNNNLSLNASMDKTSNASTLSLNNTSILETTLNNVSAGGLNATSSSLKSHNDSLINKSSQSVLKYDCTLNSNPIAASTRVSALNIVADLLKKLDNLEAKLKSWKTQKSPSQRLIEATASYNNNENSCSIDNIDKIKK